MEKRLLLELKLLADVGLIGFPNAGKARSSPEFPGSAEGDRYPFTTPRRTSMVQYKDNISFVMATSGLIGELPSAPAWGSSSEARGALPVLVHLVDLGAFGEGGSRFETTGD